MSQTDRTYHIHHTLARRRTPIPLRQLAEQLEVSEATVKRDLEKLRDMGAPIPPGQEAGGYFYDSDSPEFELPGLWFNQFELYALLATEQLLEAVQPGVLNPQLGRLKGRVHQLLGTSGFEAATVSRRIRLQPMGARPTDPDTFGTVAGATLGNRRLGLAYHSRHRDETTSRRVRPYRLVHYRDNWYLLAWCELAEDHRLFSLDRIQSAHDTGEAAPAPDEDAVDRYLGAAFGIFTGEARDWAVLHFTPEAARWAAEETWHPDQVGYWQEDKFELQVPFSDDRELAREILKFGPDCEVVAPEGLRKTVAERLRRGGGDLRGLNFRQGHCVSPGDVGMARVPTSRLRGKHESNQGHRFLCPLFRNRPLAAIAGAPGKHRLVGPRLRLPIRWRGSRLSRRPAP